MFPVWKITHSLIPSSGRQDNFSSREEINRWVPYDTSLNFNALQNL